MSGLGKGSTSTMQFFTSIEKLNNFDFDQIKRYQLEGIYANYKVIESDPKKLFENVEWFEKRKFDPHLAIPHTDAQHDQVIQTLLKRIDFMEDNELQTLKRKIQTLNEDIKQQGPILIDLKSSAIKQRDRKKNKKGFSFVTVNVAEPKLNIIPNLFSTNTS